MNASSSRSHCVFTIELSQTEGKKCSKITLVDLAGSEKTETAKTEGQGLLEGININKSLSCLGSCIGALAKAAARKDKEEAAKSEEQKAAEKKAAEEEEAKQRKAEEKAKAKAAAAKDSKFGMKIGGPVKTIKKSDDFIPFRDSVLTWILRDSLCGNSKTVMLAALSPAAANYQETLSTLRFAQQAKSLKTKAIVNEDPVQRLINELRAEIEKLKGALAADGKALPAAAPAAGAPAAAAPAAAPAQVEKVKVEVKTAAVEKVFKGPESKKVLEVLEAIIADPEKSKAFEAEMASKGSFTAEGGMVIAKEMVKITKTVEAAAAPEPTVVKVADPAVAARAAALEGENAELRKQLEVAAASAAAATSNLPGAEAAAVTPVEVVTVQVEAKAVKKGFKKDEAKKAMAAIEAVAADPGRAAALEQEMAEKGTVELEGLTIDKSMVKFTKTVEEPPPSSARHGASGGGGAAEGGGGGGGINRQASVAALEGEGYASPEEIARRIKEKEDEIMARVAAEMRAQQEAWKEKERNMMALAAKHPAATPDFGRRSRASLEDGNMVAGGPAGAGSGGATRQITTLHTMTPRSAALSAEAASVRPFLTVLSRDPSLSRTVRIFVGGSAAGGKKLRVGRPGAKVPQDLEVDGIGIAAESLVIWPAPVPAAGGADTAAAASNGAASEGVVFHCCAASREAIVYVNGRRLEFDTDYDVEYLAATANVSSWNHNVAELRHNDRVSIGHCAYVFLVVAPAVVASAEAAATAAAAGAGGDGAKESRSFFGSRRPRKSLYSGSDPIEGNAIGDLEVVTYDTCVQEVVLRRQEGEQEYKERLAHFVLTRWRLPATRAAFQELLLGAVHAAQEANAVAAAASAFVRFRIAGGSVVDTSRLYSLRLEDGRHFLFKHA